MTADDPRKDFEALKKGFGVLKKGRRKDPFGAVRSTGSFAESVLGLLEAHCEAKPFAFKGKGDKRYVVFVIPGTDKPFSRPVNADLFVHSPQEFADLWERFIAALERSSQPGDDLFATLGREAQAEEPFILSGIPAEEIDRAFYTAVVGYGAVIDLFSRGNRAAPGTLLEMAVGPVISLLSGRKETGEVRLEVEGTDQVETVTTDLTFVGDTPALVVPTKITTRDRIVQPFAHQRILNAARPGMYRSVLCACSENNVGCPTGTEERDRTYEVCWLQDTLVAGTIALYQSYVAPLAGLYYLDPPQQYLEGAYGGLPPVKRFGSLLTEDLPTLLSPAT